MATKVNFEITDANPDRGYIYVNYWADGIDPGLVNIGPYEIVVPEEFDQMTANDQAIMVASYGVRVVVDQIRIQTLANANVVPQILTWQGQQLAANIADPAIPEEVDELLTAPVTS